MTLDMYFCAALLAAALLITLIARINGDEETVHIPFLVSISCTALIILYYIMRIYEVIKHAANP